MGAIDGISYNGMAQSLALQAFLAKEDLPELFHSVTVQFALEDEIIKSISLTPGNAVKQSDIPEVPELVGYSGFWSGLDDTDLSRVLFDHTFEAAYIAFDTTISTDECRENLSPVLLAEGTFTKDASILLSRADVKPALDEQETFLEAWAIGLPDTTEQLRFLSPVDLSENTVKLMTLREDGTWQELSYHVDGRYMVFPAAEFEMTLAVILIQKNYDVILWAVPAALVIVIGSALYYRKKKQISSACTANA